MPSSKKSIRNPKIKRALISVSNKEGLIPFAKELRRHKIEIISTGGTLKSLHDAKIPATAIDQITGFPEMMDGRVKTLHPKIHGGLLYVRGNQAHEKQAKAHSITAIDLVVVNLYPFEEVTSKPGVELAHAIENIDIGGPSMLRSAAKNFRSVTVVCDPNDYHRVVLELDTYKSATSYDLRFELAQKVYARTASYDAAIATHLSGEVKNKSDELPVGFAVGFKKLQDLRYGENPHQKAAFYASTFGGKKFGWKQLHGKELSFNNLVDMEAAIEGAAEFKDPTVVVVKHTNPSGIAQNKNMVKAVDQAIDSDPVSAFGGVIGLNRICTEEVAAQLLKRLGFFEIIAAPAYKPKALALLQARKNLRIMEIQGLDEKSDCEIKLLRTGALVQTKDHPIRFRLAAFKKNLKWVTKHKLRKDKLDELVFAYQCAKLVKSNAIVLTQGFATVGVGAGQMSRVDSTKIACDKATGKTRGAFLGSDAFFPMPDSVEYAAKHGIEAIIQPGGSIKDQEVIDVCNRLGIAMLVTGERHFKH
ncbi:MAG TPA: bifunctional phosphoribosylaminoimidazolecarboxamide formyltransferase/IMP cyclohydrolase [Candidatus Omnitrophota bacterium]|nr:bifunctional phosphoribosylaminoimidazolecarboxamide formyltransferase/inosine monophosphate cyclohydrolase [Candidatus Omnitrophota bacterium]HRK62227.1 bifunctional phosphoribosylaminoimidazolecarboxamide formyltransferase/IMP cyclohydrolase [Candidatus Omnitrophota bacterium]